MAEMYSNMSRLVLPIFLVICFIYQFANSSDEPDINKVEWWKKTNFYHIYLRSFKDSDGDGHGDIRGLIEKIDYLKDLGVETLLMAPIYKSPMKDGGYDISDYVDINPLFGTMADLDELLAKLKSQGMRIVMDFVPNHSSNEHYWFKCSERALIDVEECGKYKDYYIWSSSKRYNNSYPNNWINLFNGDSGWRWSPTRQQFYLHQFLAEQPDLNLTNPLVREEFKNIARFWLAKGVDGLRIDAVPFFLEDTEFWRDEPVNVKWQPGDYPWDKLLHIYTFSYEGTPEIVKDWRDVSKEFEGDRVIVNEAYAKIQDLVHYYGSSWSNRFTDMNFGFGLFALNRENLSPSEIELSINLWYNETRKMNWPNERGTISPWLTWVLGNHDNSRRMNILGECNVDVYFWLGFLLPGTPVFYYGDEIGMSNAREEDIPEKTISEGEPTRLVERAIMAWTPDEPSGNFSMSSETWMPLPRNYKSHNVKTMLASKGKNHLKNYMGIQNLRKKFIETLTFGSIYILRNHPADKTLIFAMLRAHDKFGNLLLLVNLHETMSERVKLIEDSDKPKLPKRGRIELMNYEASDTQFSICGSDQKLFEGQEIELMGLTLCPSQAMVISYNSMDNDKN